MPRLHPFLQGLEPTLHIAHRGGAKVAPENTLEAFRNAFDRYGTQMLELDVHLTHDGEIVVAHDDTVDRCTDGIGAIRAMTLAELRTLDAGYHFTPDGEHFPFRGSGVRMPTLREVLHAFPGLRINVELKDDEPELERRFVELIRGERAVNRICCGSERDSVAERLQALIPEACHFYPASAGAEFILSLQAGGPPAVDDRYQVLDIPAEFGGMWIVDDRLVDAARQHEKWINCWTIDDPDKMRRLIDLGVGGIMTDRPDVLRQVLDERRPR